MSDYIPDPIELMEMRAERMMEEYFRGDKFICCICENLFDLEYANSLTADPSSPPACWDCLENHLLNQNKITR